MIWALHGNLGSPADWEALQGRLRTSLFERVNLWAETILPFQDWGKRLNHLAGAMDPHPVLLGYSLGARLAMHALHAPEAPWKAAVFVSGHPGLEGDGARTLRLLADLDWADRLRTGGIDHFLNDWNAQEVLADGPVPENQREIVTAYANRIADAFEAWSLGRQRYLVPVLATCPTPQMWVVGESDEKFSSLAGKAAEEIPSASLHVISQCGHRVPLQQPQQLADCVRNFLSDLSLTDV